MNTDVEEQMLDLVKKVAGMGGAGLEGDGERGAICIPGMPTTRTLVGAAKVWRL